MCNRSVTLGKPFSPSKFTIIWWIRKLLGRSLRHHGPRQNPIHAGRGGHVRGRAEGLRLGRLRLHHGHPLLSEVMTQQLPTALSHHLGVQKTLLIPKEECSYTHVAGTSQFIHTGPPPYIRRERKTPNAFLPTKGKMHNSPYGKGIVARWGGRGAEQSPGNCLGKLSNFHTENTPQSERTFKGRI